MTNLLDFNSNPELFALEALEYIKHKKIEQFITTVQHLNDCYDKEFAKLQKFAEYCIKDILILLQASLNNTSFEYLLWSSLNLTLFSPIAQKYVWRDKTILVSFKTALLLANQTNNGKLVKATTNFLSSALVGAPDDFFEKIHELRIIVSLLAVLSNSSNYSEESLKSIICCFGLLCDGTENCKKDLVDLDVGKFVLDIGEKYALDEDFNELAALTYDDIIFLKQDGRTIGRQKFIKSQIDRILMCSNLDCLQLQKTTKFKKCSRCKLTVYCSKSCQLVHWKMYHHKVCSV